MPDSRHSSAIQLRPYQEECLASIPDAGAFLICMATGPAYEPPTEKQKYFLRRNGYEVEGLSKYEAMKIIGRLKGA